MNSGWGQKKKAPEEQKGRDARASRLKPGKARGRGPGQAEAENDWAYEVRLNPAVC